MHYISVLQNGRKKDKDYSVDKASLTIKNHDKTIQATSITRSQFLSSITSTRADDRRPLNSQTN